MVVTTHDRRSLAHSAQQSNDQYSLKTNSKIEERGIWGEGPTWVPICTSALSRPPATSQTPVPTTGPAISFRLQHPAAGRQWTLARAKSGPAPPPKFSHTRGLAFPPPTTRIAAPFTTLYRLHSFHANTLSASLTPPHSNRSLAPGKKPWPSSRLP